MANVDSKLHNDADALDRSSEPGKKGVRGLAGGGFIGSRATPNRTTDHADGAGSGVSSYTRFSRETGPNGALSSTAYRGDGVQGGSVPGDPAGSVDNRTTVVGDAGRALGQEGRGTMGGSLDAAVVASGTGIAKPTLQGDEVGFAVDIVELVDGVGAIDADVDATTVTKYPSGKLELIVFARGTDTDEDGDIQGKGDWDLSATQSEAYGAAAGPAALAAGTYAVYGRFITSDGAVGPMSARFVITVT